MHPLKTDDTGMPKALYSLANRIAFFMTCAIGVSPAHAGLFGDKLMINGAGATFPYPLYSRWFSEYQKQFPEVAFNYQSIGSGGGIRQLLDETVDFGASDSPMTDEQLAKSKRAIAHIPATMGAVVLTYNLPSVKTPIKMTGAIVADIFQKKITKWNDPRIVELNPSLKDALSANSAQDILVVHRADGSGTTAVFSEYLSKVSGDWKTKVGSGTALRWPVGIGGKGNEGVTSFVQQIPGSIGYVELVFAKTLKLPFALIDNPRHEFIEASAASVTAAAEGALKKIPDDFRTSITSIDAVGAYPISSFSYILIYENGSEENSVRRNHILKFLRWGLTTGQEFSPKMNYAPLPKPLIDRVLKKITQLQASSK
jgi:phosphate transport system substrate-binding protein